LGFCDALREPLDGVFEFERGGIFSFGLRRAKVR
jgi:hypothetical protein